MKRRVTQPSQQPVRTSKLSRHRLWYRVINITVLAVAMHVAILLYCLPVYQLCPVVVFLYELYCVA